MNNLPKKKVTSEFHKTRWINLQLVKNLWVGRATRMGNGLDFKVAI